VRAVERNGEREVRQPEVLRRVIRPETAATLTAIMEAVTERGTARTAKLDRYQVAGKTGTAKQVVDGRYSDTDYNASFVGFVPSRRPAFTILIVIDRPRSGSHYGGAVAAPVFKRIAEAALRQWGVPPTIDPLPPVILADDREPTVRRPAAPAISPASVPLGGQALMPDVRGLSLRTAVRTLADAGLETSVSGSGLVVDQTPAPGEPIAPATWGAIRLDRRGQERTTRGDGR
jgi:membrane peptidoglycan carboxypeptidase